MRSICRIILAAACCAAIPATFALPRIALAQGTAQKQGESAAEIIEKARKALGEVRAISYRSEAVTVGELAGTVPDYEATISAARAEAGGWKLYAKGGVKDKKDDSGFEVGYDGVTARSIKVKDKTVFERTAMELSEVEQFFSTQQARQPVVWEILDDKPFTENADKAVLEGQEKVAGVLCNVVKFPGREAPATDAGKQGGTPEVGGETGLRVFFSTEDFLPRRIERLRTGVGEGASKEKQARIVTLHDVRTNERSLGAPYTLSVPDGFRVRAQQAERPLRTQPQREGQTPDRPRRERPAAPARQDNGLLAVGTKAPAWTVDDAAGGRKSLKDFEGKVVLMDFWATWCGPCKAAMPSIQKLHDKYKDKPVAVLGMNCWERGDPAKYMRDQKFTYGLMLKCDDVATRYKVTGIPAFYLIGPDGTILWNAVGFSPRHEKEIGDLIDAELKKLSEKGN